jgi:nanoRNase/pAp phosphatase (c-di-AMP/oligoRNAs hydrolase)
MLNATVASRNSDRLLAALAEYEQVLVIMHDNPDPDAIASAWAVSVLVEEKLGLPVRIVAGGAIVRAENRHMVDLLQPPIELVDSCELCDRNAMVLVDCSPSATNQLLWSTDVGPVGVIDHHTNGADDLPFADVRPEVAASASITAGYLREQKLEPGFKLATALVYAIRTETKGYETKYSPLDRSIIPWLTERCDPALLAEIENAPLSRAYFGDLVLALQNTFLYEDTAICFLPKAEGIEIVGEVADTVIRCESVRRVLCAAVVGKDLYLSSRTANDAGHAAKLLQKTLDGLGGAGGHVHRAGGKISKAAHGDRIAEDLGSELRQRWLAACGIDQKRGRRLIPKRDIVDNL